MEAAEAVEELAEAGHLRGEEAAELRAMCLSHSAELAEVYRGAAAGAHPMSRRARFLRAYRQRLSKL
eukprot:tig00000789_g4097.t1